MKKKQQAYDSNSPEFRLAMYEEMLRRFELPSEKDADGCEKNIPHGLCNAAYLAVWGRCDGNEEGKAPCGPVRVSERLAREIRAENATLMLMALPEIAKRRPRKLNMWDSWWFPYHVAPPRIRILKAAIAEVRKLAAK